MPLTHISCDFTGAHGAAVGSTVLPQDTESIGFAAVNPAATPGSLIAAISAAGTEGISAQVAAKLSLEHFISGTLDHYWELLNSSDPSTSPPTFKPETLSSSVLEAGFRRANSSVYDFGHKLAAGGRMGASLLSVVITDGVVTTGRVGRGEALLRRGNDVFPFFADPPPPLADAPAHPLSEDLVGAHSKVAVEVATVPLQAHDSILLFPRELARAQRDHLCKQISQLPATATDFQLILQDLYPSDAAVGVYVVNIGDETIFLREHAPH